MIIAVSDGRPRGASGRAASAVVVGSGPNGLTAAAVLARAGVAVEVLESAAEPGGGARSAALTGDGLTHDTCSGVHPLGVASPAWAALDLRRHGLRWCWADVELAHPFDDGTAAVVTRSVAETAARLGGDGPAWWRMLSPLASGFDALSEDVMRPLLSLPRHPATTGRFALYAGLPASVLARRMRTREARGLLGGLAAHAFAPLARPGTASFALLLGAAAHARGWPVAEGGSGSITAALSAALAECGGSIRTGVTVRSLGEVADADVVLLDVAPAAAAEIAGSALPRRVGAAYRHWRHGPAAWKLDMAVRGGVPWSDPAARRAVTVHVCGTLEEVEVAERLVGAGRMPEAPFVVVAQQHVADPSRSVGDLHPVWAYSQVPAGWEGDAAGAVLAQMERFAPGLGRRISGMHSSGPRELASYDANYVGGDIATGAYTPLQAIARPRLAADPYSTGIPGVFLCSAATPPGPGAHGMCGWHAARSALRWLRRRGATLPAPFPDQRAGGDARG